MAQDDELIFAMSVVEKRSALDQRTSAVVKNPNIPVINNQTVVMPYSTKSAAETVAIQIPQPQESKLPSPEMIDDRPPNLKPPTYFSVDCQTINNSSSSVKSKPKLSSSANFIFNGREPIRTVGFNAPTLPSSSSVGPRTLK